MHMKKPLKITLYVVGCITVFVVIAVAVLLWSQRKLDRVINVSVAAVPYATGAEAVERGKYLYLARGCVECHGADGTGRIFIDDPNGLRVRGANITTGQSGAVHTYTEADWVRAIRHGVKPDGRPVFIMPSEDYNRFTDGDLADLVAYVRSLPPASAPAGALIELPLIVKLLHGAGVVKDAAEKIDHSLPPSQPVAVGATLEHGLYVAQTCIGCHGAKHEGGPIPGAPPDWPSAANLAAGKAGVMGRYQSLEQFKTMLRSGTRPDGSQVNTVMPLQKNMNDTDLEALYIYFRSLGAG
jgi:mono/diheme cytochrome c family protein